MQANVCGDINGARYRYFRVSGDLRPWAHINAYIDLIQDTGTYVISVKLCFG